MIPTRARRLMVCVAAFGLLATASPALAQEPLVQIYLVRHPETDPTLPDTKAIHLSDVGRERASLLARTFSGVPVSHLFASHTVRTRETLETIASERSLAIVQLPMPGSVWNGQAVTDEMSRREAIDPIANALLALRPGSIALVALNSENIFAVINRLGVPAAGAGATCEVGRRCVPCLNNTCFPRDAFDRIWYIARRAAESEPLVFAELRYGVGWAATRKP